MMWNDTDTPLAYLITFRCYGTWLHGDERGSIDRHNNKFGAPKYPSRPHWNEISKDRQKHPPVKLDAKRRRAVKRAVIETCRKRGWSLHAVHVRTNHGHVVADIGAAPPDVALTAFKANATRHMREDGCWSHEHSPWAGKGSKRRLWNERSVVNAVDYVINRQGDELPDDLIGDSACRGS